MMYFTSEISWREALAYSIIFLIAGGFYELWQWLKTCTRTYRIAFGLGLTGAFLIIWVNGAVGIIGSEDNPANLMYGAVFIVGCIGALISRFKPRGMMYTVFTAGLVQVLVPFVALFIWPAQVSWGEAWVTKVLVFNCILALPFIGSALLFLRVANKKK
jgi:hypothetical protein